MRTLLNKEARLTTPVLTYCFLAFSLLTFCPGYPILLSAFFVCLGFFQAYQSALLNHDLLFSLLLPVAKKDVVKSKFIFACLLEMTAFFLISLITIIRMLYLNQTAVFRANKLMNANPLFLAFTLLIFAEFNWFFIGGFFKTGYRLVGPFMSFTLAAMITIIIAESLHHLPGLAALNSSHLDLSLQLVILLISLFLYCALTFLVERGAVISFDNLDF